MAGKIKYCAKCNTPIPGNAKFCFECGGDIFLDKPKAQERYCIHCFIKLDNDEEVCPLCEGEEFVNSIDELYEIKNKEAIAKDKSALGKIVQKTENTKEKIKLLENQIKEQKKVMLDYPSIEEMRKQIEKLKAEANKEIESAKVKYNKHLEDEKKAKETALKSKDYESDYNKLLDETSDIDAELSGINEEVASLQSSINNSKDLINEYERRIKNLVGKKPEFYDAYLRRLYVDIGRYLYEWEKYHEAEYFLLLAHKLGSHLASAFLLFMYLDPDNPLYNEKEADKIADVSIDFFKKNKHHTFYEALYRLCCSIKDSKHYSMWAVNEAKNNFIFTFTNSQYVYANYILFKREKCYPEMYLILCDAFNKTITYEVNHESKIKNRITQKINKLKSIISKEDEKIGMELFNFKEVLIPDYASLIDARMGYSRSMNAYKELIDNKYYKALAKFAYLSRVTFSVDRIDDRKKALLLDVDLHKCPTAIAELGWYYLEKFTVRTQSNNKALEYFTKAYKMECLDGAVGLGICYLYGYGVEKDEVKGLEYLKLAAEHTCHRAYVELGKYYFKSAKYEEALPYLELAYAYKEPVHYELAWVKNKQGAKINEVISIVSTSYDLSYGKKYIYSLDLLYLQGLLHEHRYKESDAINYFTRAAEHGHIASIKHMIKKCEVRKDSVRIEYFKKLLKEAGENNG